ncbi:oxygenase MpaB family protein [Hugenholtzia roseola]|uniref:oxygenase MpaB family protein n=1 Tax=Hugenholtzia roseola TaxID=1002 RepID=UPI0003F6DAF5|nr:oxygenase MpaB family protein [Hugenholtzia roseola]
MFAPNLDLYRQKQDPLADQTVRKMLEAGQGQLLRHFVAIEPQAKQGSNAAFKGLSPHLDLYMAQLSTLPAWVCAKRVQAGAAFFAKYALEIMPLLGAASLPYCYAAADGARVLLFSERLQKDAQQRLLETGRFVFEVMQKGAFQNPDSQGFMMVQKVRLLHALIRHGIGKAAEKNPQLWQPAWGMPINQEDLAGTNLAFSYLIVRGLRKMGYHIEPQQADDYLYLWAVVSHLLGIEAELLVPNMAKARLLAQAIERRQFRSSPQGRQLTSVLVAHFHQNLPPFLPKGYIETLMRHLLGDKVADMIALPQANWTAFLVEKLVGFNALRQFFLAEDNYEQAEKLVFVK